VYAASSSQRFASQGAGMVDILYLLERRSGACVCGVVEVVKRYIVRVRISDRI
jgi:hypothetical protein